MAATLYHNPRCSKSRKALELLEENGAEFEIVEYLSAGLTADVISGVIAASDSPPSAFVRTGDDAFKALGVTLSEDADVSEVAALLAANPAVMQRPVLVAGDSARIGRPPERILELL